MLVSLGLFFYGASQLNTLAFALAPVAAIIVVGYSYVKYHSWAAHYALGFADGLAPAGAWIGVTGSLDPEAILLAFAVTFWVGGFDVFYGTLDYDFDKGYGGPIHRPEDRHIRSDLVGTLLSCAHPLMPPSCRPLDGAVILLLHRLGLGSGYSRLPAHNGQDPTT